MAKIRKSEAHDEEVVKAVESMKKAGVKKINAGEWKMEQGLVLWRGKVYVLKDEKLQMEIIRLHHDTSISGHGGQWKMWNLSQEIIGGQESPNLLKNMSLDVTNAKEARISQNHQQGF